MKKMEMNSFLSEISKEEQCELNGGWIPLAIAVAIGISIMNNWGDVREGWSDGSSGHPPRH